MNTKNTTNFTMLTDFYELTMANGYLKNGMKNRTAHFDVFFRKVPDNGGFAIMAGLQEVISYIKDLEFTKTDLDYLRSFNCFDEEFLQYLKNFKFTCDISAVEEGTPIFPYAPIMTVKGPIIEAQFVETMILLAINHQSLIATKANRIVRSAAGKAVFEFGSRRAQGHSGAYYGARSAMIGGCNGTSCVIVGKDFNVNVAGTMAHSWVQSFDSELEAFCAYAKTYPEDCVLLVDTYNTLKSGVPNAIEAFKQEILPQGLRPKGIRLDSGDIAYLSRKARVMLDESGFEDCPIIASNSLDEYIIKEITNQGGKVDVFGVGERLITSASSPVFGGVYKLCALEDEQGNMIPKIKLSENVSKITNPYPKQTYRLYDNETNMAIADLITLADEVIDQSQPYELFDPDFVWKRKTISNYTAYPLLKPIFIAGALVYKEKTVDEISVYCKQQVSMLWEEVKRFENPHKYYVDLSQQLWEKKQKLLSKYS